MQIGVMATFIKGTCPDMCPVQERKLRESEGLLHKLELLPGSKLHPHAKGDKKLMVKSFSRSAAGQHAPRPDELRPLPILKKTVKHLLTYIVQREDLDWYMIYDFVFDRLRAVRQDMVVQGLDSHDCIGILEPIIRFHAYAGYRLCEETKAKFDSTLNHSHLLECLKRLLVLYDGLDENQYFNSRAELEALYIVFCLGDFQSLTRALNLPVKLRQHQFVKTAVEMSLAFWNGNYIRSCRLISKLPPLVMCVAAQKLPIVRRHAFLVMCYAYHSKNLTFPLDALRTVLLYQTNEQASCDCKLYEISVSQNSVTFNKSSFKPATQISSYYVTCVENALKAYELPDLLTGKERGDI